MVGNCAICGREETLTKHHLIPRTRHHNKRNKREFSRETVKKTVGICRPCHSQIHALLTEKELERDYPTVEKLRAHPEVRKFTEWIATKPRGFRCITRKQGGE
jgi:Fe-S oxidoreductase